MRSVDRARTALRSAGLRWDARACMRVCIKRAILAQSIEIAIAIYIYTAVNVRAIVYVHVHASARAFVMIINHEHALFS